MFDTKAPMFVSGIGHRNERDGVGGHHLTVAGAVPTGKALERCALSTFPRRGRKGARRKDEVGTFINVKETDMDLQHLSNMELLGEIVGRERARALLTRSLPEIFEGDDATPSQRKLLAARELVKRYHAEALSGREILASPVAVRSYLISVFAGMEHEAFHALFLDAQNRLITAEELFRGTLAQTSVYPREVVKRSLRHNAGAVVFAHNHPSGVAEPSRADELLTQSLKQALALVDIRVLDHFVVAGSSCVSFAERGLL